MIVTHFDQFKPFHGSSMQQSDTTGEPVLLFHGYLYSSPIPQFLMTRNFNSTILTNSRYVPNSYYA